MAMGGTLMLSNRPDGGGLEATLTLRNAG
ncbi:hypothetical protein M3553_22850 [Bacillus subtilis]|nr:hypothetical protein [Bacillus subtilis]